MSKFAKLYERDDQQALVTVGSDDEGAFLSLRTETNASEHSVESKMRFKGKNEREKHKAAGEAFEKVDEGFAWQWRDALPGIDM